MVVPAVLLIAIPSLLFALALPWANSHKRRAAKGPALALRLATVYFVIGGICGAAAIGLAMNTIGVSLTALGLGSLSLALGALAMSDDTLLPRARPLERWEIRWLWRLLAAAAVLGCVILIDVRATHHRPAVELLAASLAVALSDGVLATSAMLRG